MSKQRKPPERASGGPSSEREREPALETGEEHARGNAALQDRVGGLQGDGALEAARDIASPMVERAILALQITPQAPDRLERHLQILERSRLPDDRKELLIDRLRTGDLVARGVGEAVQRWFAGDDESLRGDLVDALDAVWHGLRGGASDGATWRIGEGVEVSLSEAARAGALGDRAEALIADVAGAVVQGPVAERTSGGAGEAVRGLCRDIGFSIVFDDEEEEEEEGWGYDES